MRPKRASMRTAIDPDQDDWLRAQARYRRCSVGQVVRTIVLEAMERERGVGPLVDVLIEGMKR